MYIAIHFYVQIGFLARPYLTWLVPRDTPKALGENSPTSCQELLDTWSLSVTILEHIRAVVKQENRKSLKSHCSYMKVISYDFSKFDDNSKNISKTLPTVNCEAGRKFSKFLM